MATYSQRTAERALSDFFKRRLGDRLASFTERELPAVHAELGKTDLNGSDLSDADAGGMQRAHITKLVIRMGLAEDGTLFTLLQKQFEEPEVLYEINELAALFLAPIEVFTEPFPLTESPGALLVTGGSPKSTPPKSASPKSASPKSVSPSSASPSSASSESASSASPSSASSGRTSPSLTSPSSASACARSRGWRS